MTKFKIGDRVKCIADDPDSRTNFAGIVGTVYVVTDCEHDSVSVAPTAENKRHDGCSPSRFELYAKAGEFVEGDFVVNVHDSDAKVRLVKKAAPVTAPGLTNLAVLALEDGNTYAARGFRLATSEDIAAAADKIAAELADPKNFDKPLRPLYDWKPDLARIGDGPNHPSVAAYEERVAALKASCANEIPAADFDFSTIKRGDLVTIQMKAHDDGIGLGDMIGLELPDGGLFSAPLEMIHSVIPAPKPKTLRERAIKAAMKADLAPIGEPISFDYAHIVDAVLAEVEKG